MAEIPEEAPFDPTDYGTGYTIPSDESEPEPEPIHGTTRELNRMAAEDIRSAVLGWQIRVRDALASALKRKLELEQLELEVLMD